MTQNNVLALYLCANQRNYSTSLEFEQENTFINGILISKAGDICCKWFFGSVISESRLNDKVPETSVTVKS